MTNKEYDKAKEECWVDFCRKFLPEADSEATMKDVIDYAFDRAYALGKQETKQEPNFFQNGNTHYSGNHIPDVRNMVNTRLHIAAMVMAGALANKNVTIGRGAFEDNLEYITKTALMYADALIAECEKGGNDA